MNCPDVRRLLHPYADGELDLVRQIEVDDHVAGCAACNQQADHLRSLRAAVSSPELRYRAPRSLRTRIHLDGAAPAARGRRRSPLQVGGIAAGIMLLVGVSASGGMLIARARTSPGGQLVESVVACHVRSLQADHLTDVPSTDRHTVKPWFGDKLDFSPQVPDLTADGYELAGGRLDYLAGRPVAALVYRRRLHAINLFTWPAGDDAEKPVRALARQGFHIREWQKAGMSYWAISDLNEQDLNEFARLFVARTAERQP